MKICFSLVILAFVAEMALGMPKETLEGLIAKRLHAKGFVAKGFMEKLPNFLNRNLTAKNPPSPPKNTYPHQLSLQVNYEGKWRHGCGGSILGEDKFLTSAICGLMWAIMCPDYECRIVAGAHDISVREDTQQHRGVRKMVIHPEFDFWDYDYAVFYTDAKFNFNHAVNSIGLTSAAYPSGNCIASGWGLDGYNKLWHVNVTIVQHDKCQEIYSGQLTERIICEVCDCKYDVVEFGGPMICNGALAGVGSLVDPPCGMDGYPGTFSNIAKVKDWIRNPKTL